MWVEWNNTEKVKPLQSENKIPEQIKKWVKKDTKNKVEELNKDMFYEAIKDSAKNLKDEIERNSAWWEAVNDRIYRERWNIEVIKNNKWFVVKSFWKQTLITLEMDSENNKVVWLSIKWLDWEVFRIWSNWDNKEQELTAYNLTSYEWHGDLTIILWLANMLNAATHYAGKELWKLHQSWFSTQQIHSMWASQPFRYWDWKMFWDYSKRITHKTYNALNKIINNSWSSTTLSQESVVKFLELHRSGRLEKLLPAEKAIQSEKLMKKMTEYLNEKFNADNSKY